MFSRCLGSIKISGSATIPKLMGLPSGSATISGTL